MTNEAAERLRNRIWLAPNNLGLYVKDLDEALAAERRATVERIRARLTIHNEFGCTNVLWPDEVNAILDEEAK